jgi:acetoacetyl-CoA synthetase
MTDLVRDATTRKPTASGPDGSDCRSSRLVLLKPGVEHPPIFMLPGITGCVDEIAPLAGRLGCSNPVYAVQPHGLDPSETPFELVEDIASYCLAAMKTEQPKGPYLLVGYSFGGLVAVAIGRLLLEAGESPAFLACLDPYIHRKYWPRMARARVLMRRPGRRLASIAHSVGVQIRVDTPEYHRFVADPPLPDSLRHVHQGCLLALSRHRPRYYPGKIVFFRPRIRANVPDPVPIWRQLARELQVYSVKGDHIGMISSECDDLAIQLSHCIREALEAERRVASVSRGGHPAS